MRQKRLLRLRNAINQKTFRKFFSFSNINKNRINSRIIQLKIRSLCTDMIKRCFCIYVVQLSAGHWKVSTRLNHINFIISFFFIPIGNSQIQHASSPFLRWLIVPRANVEWWRSSSIRSNESLYKKSNNC